MSIHIVYIVIIILLLSLLWMVWRAHVINGHNLLNINCVVAEMLLDETRYQGIKLIFDTFIHDEKQPINQQAFDKGDFDKNRTYWLSTAFQTEKATQNLMLGEAGNGYETLAYVLNSKITQEKMVKEA